MANLLDRIVGAFDPIQGLRRHTARELLKNAEKRAYEGASKKDGWRPRRPGASAETDHAMDATEMRVRARSLVQNVPYITRGLGSLTANIIGTGIVPRSLGTHAKKIDDQWDKFVEECDADDRLNFYGLQAAAYRAMAQDGEVLLRLRPRRIEDGFAVPLQLQLLEIDWLDSTKTGTIGSDTIINGIQYNPIGKRVAYWLWDQHPGELGTIRKGRTASRPVPASSVIHLYNPERPGQGRGITRLAPVIAKVRDLQTYEDAELARKNLETRLSVLASKSAEPIAPLDPNDPRSATDVARTGNLGKLAGGSIINMPDGMDITVVEPKAAPGYVEYLKHNLHIVAAGMGITYEMLTGDVSQVNFSSARVGMLEFRRNAEAEQWLTFIPKFCVPIRNAFITATELAGHIPPGTYRCDWSTPKWDYVNPVQDVRADLDEISGGLSSFSEKLRRRGYKPDLVFTELKSDLERLKKDGTLDLLVMLQKGRTFSEANQNTPNSKDSTA
jgi:lambda family phage portal protein